MTSFASLAIQNGGTIKPLIIPAELTNGTGLCNPSIFVDGDKIRVIVRHVNYTFYHSEKKLFQHAWGPLTYVHPENDIHLRTWNYYCELDDDLNIIRYNKIDTSKFPDQELWEFVGLEDARIFRWNEKLYVSGVRRDLDTIGTGRMELCEIEVLDDSVVEVDRFRIPPPNDPNSYCEKNWMPILDTPYHYIKWSNPTEVVKVNPETQTSTTVHFSNSIGLPRDIRGGSQVITIGDYYIACTHEVDLFNSEVGRKDARYYHRFVIWDKNWNIVKYSNEFSLMGGDVEFCVGFTEYKGDYLITFGFQDNAAYVLRFSLKTLENFMDFSFSKKNKIVDCFTYFNEKELLELRIKLLEDKVDKFIICDANKTHKGDSKPFTCMETLEELNLSSDKIIVLNVELPGYEEDPDPWVRERLQRNVAESFIDDDDICFVSDCDEIMNPDLIEHFADVVKKNPDHILRVLMPFLIGKANLRAYDKNDNPIEWNCPFFCMKHHLNEYSLSDIRESKTLNTNSIKFSDFFITQNEKILEGGWHFSWMGDQKIKEKKVNSFLHWNEVSLQENYEAKENSLDPLGREDHILKNYPINLLPSKIFELENVYEFLFQENKDKAYIQPKKMNHIYQQSQFGENWFSYPNLYKRIVNQFPTGSKFVEVGSWKGKSSAFMAVEIANSNKEIDFYCVDTWEGSVEHQEYGELSELYNIFIENMRPVEPYYFPLKISSLSAVSKFRDKSLDFVFIDASHEYEDVKNDILAWIPKVKSGGILAGHDYYVGDVDWCPGVKQAVNEIFGNVEFSEDCFIVRL
jgi:hypothetical protein